jgi:phosphoglycerol transferase MdoB-like AlkP superfamily enzyme
VWIFSTLLPDFDSVLMIIVTITFLIFAPRLKNMTKTNNISLNVHAVWALRLLAVLLLYALCRTFFYLFNPEQFPTVNFFSFLLLLVKGMRFDLSAIFFLNLPVILLFILPFGFRKEVKYQKILLIIFLVINIIGLMANCVDIVYYRFSLRRISFDIFKYVSVDGGNDFFSLVPRFILDFWYIPLIWIALSAILILVSSRLKVNKQFAYQKTMSYFAGQIGMAILWIGFAVICARGGFQLRPISPISASLEASPDLSPIVLNSPFTLIKSFEGTGLTSKDFYTDEKLNEIFNPEQKLPINPSDTNAFKKLNVVVVILESFSAEHTGVFNKDIRNPEYKGFTPFLDSLIGQSLSFKGFANGKQSIEGIPAVLTGLPNLMQGNFITSNYSSDKISSLASLLGPKGYTTAFFHGGTDGTMGFDSFTRKVGFSSYYGRKEYNYEADYDGKWGIWDEKFLQYTDKTLNSFKQPFFASIFTLSSHHPYSIPPQYDGMFRKGNLPIQQAVMYADFSLRKFFKTASKMPWYKNTLFVLTADHTSESWMPQYRNRVGEYRIPILFFKPGSDLIGIKDKVVQQIDILPSVLDYLHYKGKFVSFGHSVFDLTAARYNVTFVNDTYQIVQGDFAMQYDGKTIRAIYNYKKDPLLKQNLLDIEQKKSKEMEIFLKAIIQQYNNRMINNKLTTGQ